MTRGPYVNQDNYEPPIGEALPTDDIVDRDGYRDTKTQVMEMINAGERLINFRRDEFEYEEETEDFEIDPTRVPDFDAIDAAKLSAMESKRLERLREQRKKEYEEKVKQPEAEKAEKEKMGKENGTA